MKKLFILILSVFLAGCISSGIEDSHKDTLTLMTWNVHNLFDGKDDGTEYYEFSLNAGWSQEKYKGRINALSSALRSLEVLPDLIVFQEIESISVLDDLADALPNGFLWRCFAGNPGAALGLGILSRLPVLESRVHTVFTESENTPRPVLEARVLAGKDEFVIFACHWKSKLGGEDSTEFLRRAGARAIMRRIRELWDNEPDLGIIIAGDLNENHDEFFRLNSGLIPALLPDSGSGASLASPAQEDFLIITDNIPPFSAYFPDESIVLFSPWMAGLENGTYYYRNNWETIDHFLISRQFFNGESAWEYESASVIDIPPFVNSRGFPYAYNERTGAGLSDHLPLIIKLAMRNEE